LRAVLLIAVVTLMLTGFAKSRASSSTPTQRRAAAGLAGEPAVRAFCYSDIVPLYGAERLTAGHVPVQGRPGIDGTGANAQVRTWSTRVLTGVFSG